MCGANHSLALSDFGDIYGWGSNSKVQLSHEVEFSRVEDPQIAFFTPIKLLHNLNNNEVTDMAAGEEFSIIVTKNKCK